MLENLQFDVNLSSNLYERSKKSDSDKADI